MKIGIRAPYLHVFGGGEKFIGKIAEILSHKHDVELIAVTGLDKADLGKKLNVDLSRVSINTLQTSSLLHKLPLFWGFANLRRISEASENYDVFICQEHLTFIPPSRAKKSILLCEAPPQDTYHSRLPVLSRFLDPKLKTYDMVIANSLYTQKWVERFWDREATVLYPPVETERFAPAKKENIILSVGRFFQSDHCKKQREMIKAFKELCEQGLKGWEYHLVGGVLDNRRDQEYLAICRREAEGYPIYFHVDAPFDTLRELYGKSKIFWHAAGLGEDENRHPIRFEQFGIVTVEAMSAGLVPVVIYGGGQPEIVQDGISGFLFKTAEELKRHTLKLIGDDKLREQMSAAAIDKSQQFSMIKFQQRLGQSLGIEI